MSSSRPHRCDEFPAEYSLASCSPAELASASSASLMLQPTTSFVELISANGNRGTFPLSHSKGSLYLPCRVREFYQNNFTCLCQMHRSFQTPPARDAIPNPARPVS
jgi:hypothetical protein